jgi:hypothetical protein
VKVRRKTPPTFALSSPRGKGKRERWLAEDKTAWRIGYCGAGISAMQTRRIGPTSH